MGDFYRKKRVEESKPLAKQLCNNFCNKDKRTIALLLTNSNTSIFPIDDLYRIFRYRIFGTKFVDDVFVFDIIIAICGSIRYRCLARCRALADRITRKLGNESGQESKKMI